MCLYVENCVLLGLDWVELMMQFSLHVTRSCIVHAYKPFHFNIQVLFVMVFLSLSLSLSHGLRMAPKLKFAPSQNPLRSKASSSDPTPLHIQFRDELAARTSQRTTPNVAFIRNAT